MLFSIKYFDELDSTNDFLKHQLLHGEAHEGTVIVAKQQRKARGRGDHQWYSPPGVLAFSLAVTSLQPEDIFWLNYVAAVAIVSSLEQRVNPSDISLVWPNDIHCRGKKIAGILVESVTKGNAAVAIVGIGVNNTVKEFPSALISSATSLSHEGSVIEPESLLHEILENFGKSYDALRQGNHENIRRQWLEKWHDQNCEVVIVEGQTGKQNHATLISINSFGHLVVQGASGEQHTFSGIGIHVIYPAHNQRRT